MGPSKIHGLAESQSPCPSPFKKKRIHGLSIRMIVVVICRLSSYQYHSEVCLRYLIQDNGVLRGAYDEYREGMTRLNPSERDADSQQTGEQQCPCKIRHVQGQ